MINNVVLITPRKFRAPKPFLKYIKQGKTLAKNAGLNWNINLGPSGVAIAGQAWDLRKLIKDGNPVQAKLRTFSNCPEALKIMVEKGFLADDIDTSLRPVSIHWQNFIKAYSLIHMLVSGLSLTHLASTCQMLRLVATVTDNKEPWRLDADNITRCMAFWIELDLASEAAIDVQPHYELQPHQQSDDNVMYTLLCVEDNPANLMLVEDIISRRPDISLLSAKNARQGIRLARTALPDVILMDINLPGFSGFDALNMLSDDARTANIPVIALSANAMPSDIEKGLEAGFFRYLTKPIKVKEFMDTIDLALILAK